MGDETLTRQSDVSRRLSKKRCVTEYAKEWTAQATSLWDQHDTPGEFNSPTYAGITLMALGLAQYCPVESLIYKVAPKLIASIWRSLGMPHTSISCRALLEDGTDGLGETYNPSLRNVAGPWDRTYGYCMTQYYASIAVPIAAITSCYSTAPMPRPLNGSAHYSDGALIPMQILVSPYVEAPIANDTTLISKFKTLYRPHMYEPKSIFPPHDKKPREYSFYLGDGLNVGGVSYDEDQLGGPKGIVDQFVPGVVQWDSGRHGGGVGWMSVGDQA